MTKSRKLTRSRRCTNKSKGQKSKGQKSKGRSGKRKSKKPRVSRRAHSLRGGSHVAGSRSHVAPKKTQENPTIHTEESTNQHITHPTVDKESKWTKTGRALMYGVGAAGTGAFMGVLTAPLLAPKHYYDADLNNNVQFANEWKTVQQIVPQWMTQEQAKHQFLRGKDVEYYNKSHGKQNAIIGAGLAAAAAGTYGATRHKKDANATKPSKLTRAGRALMYGVGAVGTGAAIGAATALKTGPKYYTSADLQTGGSLKEEWDSKKLLQKRIQDYKQKNPDREIGADLMRILLLTEETFLDQKNMDQNNTNNKGRNAMIGAGLAAVAAGTYGATRD
jgi:hypothetical protein